MRDDEFPTKKEGLRLFGWATSSALAATAIIMLIVIAVGAFVWVWAPWKGQIEARNNTEGNGQYVVASYDYYFDQCGSIQAAEQRVKTYSSQLTATPPLDAAATVRLQAAITAETNSWINLVTEYNANADKEKYKAKFQDDRLPDHIELDNLTNGVVTTCA